MLEDENLSSEAARHSSSPSPKTAGNSINTQELLDFNVHVSESLTSHADLADKAFTLEENAVKLDVPIVPKLSLEPRAHMGHTRSGSLRGQNSSSTLNKPFDAQLLFHTTNSLIIKDIDQLLPKSVSLTKDVHRNSHHDGERPSFTSTVSSGNNRSLSTDHENGVRIESSESTSQEIMLRLQDMRLDEKMSLRQSVDFVCQNLENIQGNSALSQKFLKLFKLYVALLADSQDCTNHVFEDKYVQFLLSYEKPTIDADLQTIIERFTLRPSNIYMRLARSIYENNERFARKTLEVWKLKKVKSDCFETLAKRVDLQVLKRIFLLWTKKFDMHLKAEQESLDFRNFTLYSLNLKKWTKKALLQNEMRLIADQKQQQMILKTFFETKTLNIGKNLKEAQRLYARRVYEKRMSYLVQQCKCKDFIRSQNDKNKSHFFSLLMSKNLRLNTQYAEASLISSQAIAARVLNNQWIPKCEALSGMNMKADLMFSSKLYYKWLVKCQNFLQADELYYHTLKQRFWKRVSLRAHTKMSENYKKSCVLKKFKNKEEKCIHIAQLSNEVYVGQSLRFFLHKWKRRLQRVEDLHLVLNISYNNSINNSVIPISYKKIFFNRWSSFYVSLREQKLSLLLRDHLQDKAAVQQKRILAAWVEKVGQSHRLDLAANVCLERFTTARVFRELTRKMSSIKSLSAEAKSFDKFLVKRRFIDHFLNVHMSVEDLGLYAEEKHTLKNMETASYFIHRWGIRRMRIQNSNENAKSIRTRWNRARARGLLNLWEDRMRDHLRIRLLTESSKIQTPFTFGKESIVGDNRSPVLEPDLSTYFVDDDSPIKNSRGLTHLPPAQNGIATNNIRSAGRNSSSSSSSSSSNENSPYFLKTPARFSVSSQGDKNFNDLGSFFSTTNKTVDSKSSRDRMMQLSLSARKNRYKRTVSRPSPIKETSILSSAIKQRLMGSQYGTSRNASPTKLRPKEPRDHKQTKPGLAVTPQLFLSGD